MFKKPAGYDETTARAETTPRLPAGGYICEVIAAEVRKSRRGAEMLVLSVDVASGRYAGHFKRRKSAFQLDFWPGNAKIYQVLEGRSVAMFKRMVEDFEASNPGWKLTWDASGAFDEQKFVGLTLGCLFREEEYEREDGSVGTAVRICGTRPAAEVEDAPVPPKKELPGKRQAYDPNEEIPF